MDVANHDDSDFREVNQTLQRLARRFVRDQASAEDLAQEAWVAALEAKPRELRDGSAWLSQVVRNLASGWVRKRARRSELERWAARPEAIDDTSVRESVATFRWLEGTVASLAEPYRAVLQLRYFEECSVAEISQRLQRPELTVRTQLRRGLEQLRRRIGDDPRQRALWLGLTELGRAGSADLPATVLSTRAAASSAPAGSSTLRLAGFLLGFTALCVTAVVLAFPGDDASDPATPEVNTTGSADLEATKTSTLPDSRRVPLQGLDTDAPAVAGSYPEPEAVDRYLRLSVRVLNRLGTPVPGAKIRWEGKSRVPYGEIADSTGEALLTIPADELRADPPYRSQVGVFALAVGQACSLTTHCQWDPDTGFGPTVELRTMGPAARVEGRVVHASQPVPAAHIVAMTSVEAGLLSDEHGRHLAATRQNATADADGWFTLTDLPNGPAELRVNAPGYPLKVERIFVHGEGTQVEVELKAGASVDGFVRFENGQPAAGARIWAALSIFDEPIETRADTEGYFVLEGVQPGDRYLNASAQDPQAESSVGACQRVAVEAGGTLRWSPRLAAMPHFEVRVIQNDGSTPTEARIALFAGSGNDKWQSVKPLGEHGSATFTHLPEEPVDVFVLTPAASANGMPAAFVSEVTPSEDGIDIQLESLEARGRVQARLLNHLNGPIGEGQLLFYEARGITIIEERLELADGSIDVSLPPASYRVFWASHNGLWECTQFTLRPAETLDLGTLRAPAWVKVSITAIGLTTAIGQQAELRPRAEAIGLLISDRVLHGWDALPVELDLYPGVYAIDGPAGARDIVTVPSRSEKR